MVGLPIVLQDKHILRESKKTTFLLSAFTQKNIIKDIKEENTMISLLRLHKSSQTKAGSDLTSILRSQIWLQSTQNLQKKKIELLILSKRPQDGTNYDLTWLEKFEIKKY